MNSSSVTYNQIICEMLYADGRRADYERHFKANENNSFKARYEAIDWWRNWLTAPTNEDVAINVTASRLQEMLKEGVLQHSSALISICLQSGCWGHSRND
jgi:hypothetical protein